MEDKSVSDYVIDHLIWIVASMFLFKLVFFRVLPGYSLETSMIQLWSLIIVSCAVGVIVAGIGYRSNWNVVYSCVLAYGTYALMLYHNYFKKILLVMGVVTIILTVICWLCILIPKIKNKYNRSRIVKKRLIRCMFVIRRNVSLAMIVILIIIGYKMYFYETMMNPNMEVTNVYDEQYRFSNNVDTMMKLQEVEWEKLTLQEKLDVAQVVANCEAKYLGLSIELNVGTVFIKDGSRGYYNHSMHRIVIDTEHLENSAAEQVLKTICHECYHAYSHQLCEVYEKVAPEQKNLLIFYNVAKYEEEFRNYKDGSESWNEYISQKCEQDAYLHAEEAASEYYRLIEEYGGARDEGIEEDYRN